MKIKEYTINNKTIHEIGRFTILWNDFEYKHLKYGKYNLLKDLYDRIDFDKTSYEILRKYFNDKMISYVKPNLFIKYFFPDEANREAKDEERKHIIAFANNDTSVSESDHFHGCITIIKRYRDNLLHGIKDANGLNSQYDVFCNINNLLESIHYKHIQNNIGEET